MDEATTTVVSEAPVPLATRATLQLPLERLAALPQAPPSSSEHRLPVVVVLPVDQVESNPLAACRARVVQAVLVKIVVSTWAAPGLERLERRLPAYLEPVPETLEILVAPQLRFPRPIVPCCSPVGTSSSVVSMWAAEQEAVEVVAAEVVTAESVLVVQAGPALALPLRPDPAWVTVLRALPAELTRLAEVEVGAAAAPVEERSIWRSVVTSVCRSLVASLLMEELAAPVGRVEPELV